jgi:hypothetical protein
VGRTRGGHSLERESGACPESTLATSLRRPGEAADPARRITDRPTDRVTLASAEAGGSSGWARRITDVARGRSGTITGNAMSSTRLTIGIRHSTASSSSPAKAESPTTVGRAARAPARAASVGGGGAVPGERQPDARRCDRRRGPAQRRARPRPAALQAERATEASRSCCPRTRGYAATKLSSSFPRRCCLGDVVLLAVGDRLSADTRPWGSDEL